MKQSNDSRSHPSNPSDLSQPAVSERKLAANRANAQRSTGPRTREGKARSSLNALRHGILAKSAFNVKIDGEDHRAEFDELVAGLAQEYQPRTTTEVMTVQQLAGCYWKLAKVWRYEQERSWCEWNSYDGNTETENVTEKNVFEKIDAANRAIEDGKFLSDAGLVEPTIPRASVNTILRYQGAVQTMLTRCIALLERRRKERIKSGEPSEEVDYINEATATEEPSGETDSSQGDRSDTPNGPVQKRTQKDGVEVAPFAGSEVSSSAQPHPAKPSGATKPPESA